MTKSQHRTMTGARMISLALTSCILSLTGRSVGANTTPVDLFPECADWAGRGDCLPNGRPFFMQKNCPESCHRKTHRDPLTRHLNDDEQEEFYELSAKTANGKVLPMENFEGYVTVIANAARVCDYSEVFFGTLEHMHTIHPYALEILAFPFEHSESKIDSCKKEVEDAEKKGGRKVHIMEVSKINGEDTHPVFKYLKNLFDMDEMDQNFAHYFFINPDGNLIEMHWGASYKTLKTFVDHHVNTGLANEL